MLDHLSIRLLTPLLYKTAVWLEKRGVTADHISIGGFFAGMTGAGAIVFHYYLPALGLIVLNRFSDGVDGTLARLNKPTDRGAYLDICLDFVFYSAVVFSFALADPPNNGLAAAALIFSFVGTGSTFLAYGIMAEKRKITNLRLPTKGFYYLGGLAEGTETIFFLALFCLFPSRFPVLAWTFATICFVATILRIIGGYKLLKDD